jgi:hypothetical protein
MAVANLSGIKPIEELVYVQRVRLFLVVMTLAGISSSAGKTICEWALSVYKNPRKPPVFRFPIKNAIGHQTDCYTNVLCTR